MEKDFKAAFQMLGKCTLCYDNKKEACGNANDTERFVYKDVSENGNPLFKPQLEQGRVEECVIFKQTKK